jgi:hypothetical protein
MLRDGKFIREDTVAKVAPYDTGKIKIGAHYTPKFRDEAPTPEERFAQSLVLGYREQQASFLSRVLGLMLRI